MQPDPIVREFFVGFWKLHILHHASEQPIYGHWMLAELREHGYNISPGTLYPILRRMEEYGWLKRDATKVHPHARRNYRLTPAGARVLKTVRIQLAELHDELCKTHPPGKKNASVQQHWKLLQRRK